jgi:hypothetical protein
MGITLNLPRRRMSLQAPAWRPSNLLVSRKSSFRTFHSTALKIASVISTSGIQQRSGLDQTEASLRQASKLPSGTDVYGLPADSGAQLGKRLVSTGADPPSTFCSSCHHRGIWAAFSSEQPQFTHSSGRSFDVAVFVVGVALRHVTVYQVNPTASEGCAQRDTLSVRSRQCGNAKQPAVFLPIRSPVKPARSILASTQP